MNTLLEYMTFVKGVEYLIVIAFCFGFIALWMLVNTREKETMKKVVSAVIPLSLVFGGAAIVFATYGNSEASPASPGYEIAENHSNISPAAVPENVQKLFRVNNTEYLSINSGPATEFHKVMSDKVSCKTCHHHSGDEIHACKDCHNNPFNPDDEKKPGLKAAYHQRCMSCHRDEFSGPDSCVKCHNGGASPAAVSAPARPHKLTWETCSKCHKDGIPNGGQETKIVYHDSCLKCHENGIAGAAVVPQDHAGQGSNTCDGCHRPAGG